MITNEQHIEKVALVIEDDKSVSQLIRLYLAEDGYRVLNAEDGLSGLKMATEESPDIVLLDLNFRAWTALMYAVIFAKNPISPSSW
ncbi:MAG: hypothetical protein CM1200mP39_12900 [Dehalococcoidia bacterium]|nr:MAG: hypothetical protein CM1200mP39_12900 [Dehalococcoidia bacterium]